MKLNIKKITRELRIDEHELVDRFGTIDRNDDEFRHYMRGVLIENGFDLGRSITRYRDDITNELVFEQNNIPKESVNVATD